MSLICGLLVSSDDYLAMCRLFTALITSVRDTSPMSRSETLARVWDAERTRVATDAAGVALRSWCIDTDEVALDEWQHGLLTCKSYYT